MPEKDSLPLPSDCSGTGRGVLCGYRPAKAAGERRRANAFVAGMVPRLLPGPMILAHIRERLTIFIVYATYSHATIDPKRSASEGAASGSGSATLVMETVWLESQLNDPGRATLRFDASCTRPGRCWHPSLTSDRVLDDAAPSSRLRHCKVKILLRCRNLRIADDHTHPFAARDKPVGTFWERAFLAAARVRGAHPRATSSRRPPPG